MNRANEIQNWSVLDGRGLVPGTVAYEEHYAAHKNPVGRAIRKMLIGWQEYAVAIQEKHGYVIGDDAIIGQHWANIGLELRAMLDGPVGGLDCGLVWANITDILKENGIELPE